MFVVEETAMLVPAVGGALCASGIDGTAVVTAAATGGYPEVVKPDAVPQQLHQNHQHQQLMLDSGAASGSMIAPLDPDGTAPPQEAPARPLGLRGRRGPGGRARTTTAARVQTVSVPAGLEGYRRVNREREQTPDNEIRVMGNGRVAKYVMYATRLLKEQTMSQGTAGLTIRALGRAVPVAISVCELMKRRMHGEYQVHQVTTIGCSTVVDSYEPVDPELEQREHRRSVPAISIFLSPDAEAVDKTAPGYQEPLGALDDGEERILTPPIKRPLTRAARRAAPLISGGDRPNLSGTVAPKGVVISPSPGSKPQPPVAANMTSSGARFSPRVRGTFGAPISPNFRTRGPTSHLRGIHMQTYGGGPPRHKGDELLPTSQQPNGLESNRQFLSPQRASITTSRARNGRRGRRGAGRQPLPGSPQARANVPETIVA